MFCIFMMSLQPFQDRNAVYITSADSINSASFIIVYHAVLLVGSAIYPFDLRDNYHGVKNRTTVLVMNLFLT